MEQYAAYLEGRGDSNAGWLLGFARKLVFRIAAQEETDYIARFFLETLQLVTENNGNPQQVYSVWAQQQPRLSAVLLAVMPVVAGQLFAGNYRAAYLCGIGFSYVWQSDAAVSLGHALAESGVGHHGLRTSDDGEDAGRHACRMGTNFD